jgi:enoyl-[acyl-carrier protein] reductase III
MDQNSQRFHGKVALVTGAARGIGRATSLQLARQGADVVVNFRKSTDQAQELVDEIRGLGRRAVAVQADMSDPSAIGKLFEVIAHEFGGLDLLICNAAAGMQGTLLESTPKAWDLAMNVNARSYLLCAQAAVPMMKIRGGGRIVALTAHIAVDRAFPYYGTVAASKAAIEALTTYMAVEFGPYNIVVNAVSPGLVDTDALRYFREGSALLQRAAISTPTGRVTTSEDVADLIGFLCSDEARQIAGQTLCLDGGYTRMFL